MNNRDEKPIKISLNDHINIINTLDRIKFIIEINKQKDFLEDIYDKIITHQKAKICDSSEKFSRMIEQWLRFGKSSTGKLDNEELLELPKWYIDGFEIIFNITNITNQECSFLTKSCPPYYQDVVQKLSESNGNLNLIITDVSIVEYHQSSLTLINVIIKKYIKDLMSMMINIEIKMLKNHLEKISYILNLELESEKVNYSSLSDIFFQILDIIKEIKNCQSMYSIKWLKQCPENYHETIQHLFEHDSKDTLANIKFIREDNDKIKLKTNQNISALTEQVEDFERNNSELSSTNIPYNDNVKNKNMNTNNKNLIATSIESKQSSDNYWSWFDRFSNRQ